MAKVLELIHEWKNTLCAHSKHKEDLVHIRDMHRLLSYKGGRTDHQRLLTSADLQRFSSAGYRFPDYDKRAVSVLNPSDVGSSLPPHAWTPETDAIRCLEPPNTGRAGGRR